MALTSDITPEDLVSFFQGQFFLFYNDCYNPENFLIKALKYCHVITSCYQGVFSLSFHSDYGPFDYFFHL